MTSRFASTAVFMVAVLSGLLALPSAAEAERKTVVIFHTSDMHGGVSARPARWNKADKTRLVGGFAAFKNLVSAETRPHLLLDSGDIYQGTPEGNLTRGSVVIDAMNALGYTAGAIGNHEFDYGEPNVARLSKRASFPWLAANLRRKEDGRRPKYAGDTLLVTVGGVKIGIIGIATHTTKTTTLPKNVAHLDFLSEPETAKREAAKLRKAGADVVVALAHCGLLRSQARRRVRAKDVVFTAEDLAYVGDLAIARAADVDLVLGGHMHNGLDHPWRDPESGVWIVESWETLAAVSRVVLTVDTDTHKLVSVSGELVDLWIDQYGEDAGVKALVAKYSNKIAKALDVVIGRCADDKLTRVGRLDSPLGNWIVDAMRAAAGADVAIQNTHGIRADLFKGPIRMRDMYTVMPFENTLVTVKMPGHALRKLVRGGIKGAGSALQISGMSVRWVLRKGDVRDVQMKVAGVALQDARIYTVATNNYLAGGGSGGDAFDGLVVRDTGRALRELIIEAFKAASPVKAPGVGRFQITRQDGAQK